MRVHGHNYRVTLVLEAADLDATGMVVDYGELDVFRAWLKDRFDHRHLNEILDRNPTAEHLAEEFYSFCRSLWPQTAAVMVSETDTTVAEYRP